jgi:hypothetical protein
VALTNVTSCGVALSTCTATGRPWRSAIAMIFVLKGAESQTRFISSYPVKQTGADA